MPHVPRAPRALIPLVPRALRVLVPQVSRVLRAVMPQRCQALLTSYPTCVVHASFPTYSYVSRASHLACSSVPPALHPVYSRALYALCIMCLVHYVPSRFMRPSSLSFLCTWYLKCSMC